MTKSFVESNLNFFAHHGSKIIFGLTPKIRPILLGLDDVETEVKRVLSNKNSLTFLIGPHGCGKRSLIKNLEIDLEFMKFVYSNEMKLLNDYMYRNQLSYQLKTHGVPVVLVYSLMSNLPSDPDFDLWNFILSLHELLESNIKLNVIILASSAVRIDDEKLDNRINVITMPVLDDAANTELLKNFIIKVCPNRAPFEPDLDQFSRSLSGYTAGDIEFFVNSVYRNYDPNLSLNSLRHCIQMPQFLSNNMLRQMEAIEPLLWTDIGGYGDVKRILKYNVLIPMRTGKNLAKGILFYGPPGCSKTLFVRALATEAHMRLFVAQASSFKRGLVGESEAALCQIFESAIQSAPSILFVDEINTVFTNRENDHDNSKGASVENRTLSELLMFLTRIHELSDTKPVIFVAATNHFDKLDPALIRPGRIDMVINISLPDLEARKSIVKMTLSRCGYAVDQQVFDSIDEIAQALDGQSGAGIVKTCSEITGAANKRYENDEVVFVDNPCITIDHVWQVVNK